MTNLHNRLAGLLLTLWLLVPIFALSALGQSGIYTENKENFISAIRAIGDDESQVEELLVRLDKLSDEDKRDTILLNELYNLAYRYSLLEKNSAAKRILFRQKELQQKAGLKAWLIDEWQLIGDIYMREGLVDSARYYHQKAEEGWRQSGALTEHPYILHSKAIVLESEGKLLEATQLLVRSLAIFQKQGSLLEVAVVRVTLGKIYKATKVYDKAKEHFRSAYHYFKSKGITIRELAAGVEIASVYRLQDSLQQALAWNKTNLTLARTYDKKYMLAMIYMNQANLLADLERYAESGMYLDSSRYLSAELGLSFGILLYHINKASLLVKMRKPAQALREMSIAEEEFGMLAEPKMLAEYYDIKYQAYKQLNDTGSALRYYEMSTALKDSLRTQDALQFMQEGERLIAEERNSREIAELKLAVSMARMNTLITIGVVVVVSILLFVRIIIRAQKDREWRRLAEEEKERLRLDVEQKNKELVFKTVVNASMSEQISEVIRKMKQYTTKIKRPYVPEFNQLIRDLELSNGVLEWKEFETRFTQVHDDFHEKLIQICPELSPSELKICSLLRLNLSSKEIAELTNRSNPTIVNARSQIRKKLKLSSEDNLTSYLLSL